MGKNYSGSGCRVADPYKDIEKQNSCGKVGISASFCVFLQASQARPCVRLRKSGSGLNANPLPPKRFYLMLTLWFISQPVPKNRPTETRSWKMTPVTPKERSFADIEDPNENISPFSPGETIMGT